MNSTVREFTIMPSPELIQCRRYGEQGPDLETITMIHGNLDPHPGPMIFESLAPFIDDLQYLELQPCGHTPWLEEEARDDFFELLTECLGP